MVESLSQLIRKLQEEVINLHSIRDHEDLFDRMQKRCPRWRLLAQLKTTVVTEEEGEPGTLQTGGRRRSPAAGYPVLPSTEFKNQSVVLATGEEEQILVAEEEEAPGHKSGRRTATVPKRK